MLSLCEASFLEFASSEVQTLIDLGLTVSQARVYLTLVKSGPLKIAPISELSKVARPDIYRTLAKLHQLGLVEKIIETPLHFGAIPMEKSIASLLDRKTTEYRRLKTHTKQLLRMFKGKEQCEVFQTDAHQFILIPPRKTIITRIREGIEEAQRSIDLVLSWKRFSFGITSAFTESVENALAKGVKFRFIVETPPKRNIGANVLQFSKKSPACQVRFFPNRPKTVLGIYDEKEIFVVVDPTTSLPDSPALWSNSQSLITIAQDYFDILWITALENPNYRVDMPTLENEPQEPL
jgi:sugar-specific transcriptional regulator TrmB